MQKQPAVESTEDKQQVRKGRSFRSERPEKSVDKTQYGTGQQSIAKPQGGNMGRGQEKNRPSQPLRLRDCS